MIERDSAKSKKNKRENALKLLRGWEEELKMKNGVSEDLKKQNKREK